MRRNSANVAVVGGGIVGLAHALAAAKRGLKVVLFERSEIAVGASVRNFGLLWPVGQPEGPRHERALLSRKIWDEVAADSGIYIDKTGCLHLAYREDEWTVLQEFAASPLGSSSGRKLLTRQETLALSPAVNPRSLLGAYFSPTEATVDPREAIRALPGWLEKKYGVTLRFGATVQRVDYPVVETLQETWKVDYAIICSGQDFECLFPDVFVTSGLTRCKLQMLRTLAQPANWRLGPALCAGLTLLHYDNFKSCCSLDALKERVQREMPFYVEHGIHVLLSQTGRGELTIGDSHRYGLTVDPFDQENIDAAIVEYLKSFALAPSLSIAERWHGVYPKLAGQSEFIAVPAPGVRIVNGLGGAGMTLSFGLAEEVIEKLLI
ncbi:MAG TPA: TIGR03364 family FAD-dependent oxidoreductase [Opitutaceae bacterium]|nr:TIGR03364 family FAD-dependent oxidoreductase [Opitutaceae bacterium]